MAVLTLEEARSHCRVDSGYPAAQLLPYMEGAESYVVAHLNRAVFGSQQELLDAQDAAVISLGAAFDDRNGALADAARVGNPAQRQAMVDLATQRYAFAQLAAARVMNGIEVDGAIRSAMLLILGNLFSNRETDVVGASVAALPTGVPELLRPYRLVQMP